MIEFVEVGPRDGLQNEQQFVATADKLRLIEQALHYGVRRIEVASFVNPGKVPQMADAEAVCAGLPESSATFIALVLNARGAERALACGRIDQLGAVAVATDAFAMANQGQTSAGSVAAVGEIAGLARSAGKTVQATIAAAFGCPFSGEVDPAHVIAMAHELAALGLKEVALADTIGVADPARVSRLVTAVQAAIWPLPVRVHFHNTRGTGLANVWAAIGAGASVVDGSLGGLGGCPFAPGAAGNVASEDVAFMLDRAGIETGLDLPAMIAANHWLAGVMGRKLPGMAAQAPPFPKSAQ
ncbi:MAG: hydroxymethylglutaryl-CoA lyase [Novosphingobium sp.]|uniref:hydroxymethylglutaryl-CoA lyase n=1 Tax=Novosphingobium sp. TaxID=1874826 RepID=UPI0032BE6778